MIYIAKPQIGDEEIQAVNEVLASGMLAQGPKVEQLEKDWAAYCGTKHALAVSSGTAAIHLALLAAGIGEGDEVITTPFSFIATINPILMVGAKPVLVDIDPGTFNIDVSAIEKVITKNTKAIMPVDLYGQPCDWSEIKAIAKTHNLLLIEDACQAVGAQYGDKKAGNLGDIGCFSLYATKNIMCGEGGMITTDDDDIASAVRRFRQHGMSGPYQYEHLGYNYRLTDLQAAIAIEQLKKADGFNTNRNKNAAYLNKTLKDIQGIALPSVQSGRTHAFHQYTIRITSEFPQSRDEFVESMRNKEVGVGVYYPLPLHLVEHIATSGGYRAGDFPHAERAAQEVVSLPVHPALSENELTLISNAIKECSGAK